MTEIQKMWLVLGLLFALLLAAVLSVLIRHRKRNASGGAAEVANAELAPSTLTYRARVVEQRCFITRTETKIPITVKHFVVAFQDDGGQISEIEVEEDLYGGFEVGQVGTLTVTDGRVISFLLEV